MPDLTHGKENSKDGTQISRRSVLVGGSALVAAGAKAGASTSPTARIGDNP